MTIARWQCGQTIACCIAAPSHCRSHATSPTATVPLTPIKATDTARHAAIVRYADSRFITFIYITHL